jgi:hypothetical protein
MGVAVRGRGERRAPLAVDAGGLGFRDLDAERAILAEAALAGSGLERFGLLDGSGRPADGPAVALTGLESMRFTTEQLPRLRELPGVATSMSAETGQALDPRPRSWPSFEAKLHPTQYH